MEQQYVARQPKMDLDDNLGRVFIFSFKYSYWSTRNWRLVQQMKFTFMVISRYGLRNQRLSQIKLLNNIVNSKQTMYGESRITKLKDRVVGFTINLRSLVTNDDGTLPTMGVNVRKYRRLRVSWDYELIDYCFV